MKPLENSGDLVDFKEKFIFENEKDRGLSCADKFKREMRKKYNIDVNYSNLYRMIIKYQIEKYGGMLRNGKWTIAPTKHQCNQTKKKRMRTIEDNSVIDKLEALERRVEKRMKKNVK